MSQNLILTSNYNVQKLSLGSVQSKKSRDGGNKYQIFQFFMMERRLESDFQNERIW